MVTIHVSLPEPPGERGRKVEYRLPQWRFLPSSCGGAAPAVGANSLT